MSHLPLDARAILQHLNELGYRNISAEQLREFLKGMQPHLDKQSAIKSKLSTTAATATRANNPQQPQPEPQQQPQQPPRSNKVKVIKSKRPLCHFKFYLDICDHQLTKRIEAEIKALGGHLEFFLNDSITHFITDKERTTTTTSTAAVAVVVATNSRSQRPATPSTPATPTTPQATINDDGCSASYPRKVRQTRADAILSRVRDAQQQSQQSPSRAGGAELKQPPGKSTSYIVWHTEYALRFFQRIQTELRQYLQEGAVTTTTANIQLKGNYIKIESIKRNHRPYYHLLKQPEEWPKIDLSSDDGAFRLQVKAKQLEQSMTRKSLGSRTSQRQQEKHKEQTLPQPSTQLQPQPQQSLQASNKKQTESPERSHCREQKESSDKQCGVCEICKIEYDTLSIHLQSKDHELFAKNAGNFVSLDSLIEVSASVNGFLQREAEQEQLEQLERVKLKEQQQQQIFSDMEVDELLNDSALALSLKAINQTDADSTLHQNLSSGNNNNNNKQRPSPVLREKSKRITKGKHSSEKFQATTPNNSPTTATTTTTNNPPQAATPASSTKKATTTTTATTSCSLLEQHASNATTTAATPTNPSRRKTNNSVLSPPIRAMLPPSSLYKVVEASDATATPPRRMRGGVNNATAALDSPSLIVKFQKVRQSELQRLNGEAENFMFPRSNTTRSSSELLTDVDRQTTSDVVRGQHSVSSSTNSTNDSTSEEQLDAALAAGVATTPALVQGRAAVVGRRRKGVLTTTQKLQRQLSTGSTSSSNGSNQQQPQQQQRFPNAPIQPEMQPLRQRRQVTAATRKSSRMATAIVTAATTSSQLQLRRQTQHSRRGGNKLEDGMGEQQTTNRKKLLAAAQLEEQQQQQQLEEQQMEVDEDVDEESHDESSCSSGSDEDYVASSKLHKSLPATGKCQRVADSREERAARRLSRLTISMSRNQLQAMPLKCGKRGSAAKLQGRKLKCTLPAGQASAAAEAAAATITATPSTTTSASSLPSPAKKAASPPSEQMFDCSKSARLQQLRYAFEVTPSAELWHHVFQRQDAGDEHYYSYYGSQRYRKLPYEMGPIPMERTKPHSCSICQQQQQPQQQQQHGEVERKPQLLQPIKVERDRDAETDSNQTAATTTTTSSMYKHKKLHLLQRYQQEQHHQHQQHHQQQQRQAQLNIAVPIAKCDSKASTPELLERDFAPLSERSQLVERVRAASTQSSTSSTSCSQNSQKSSVNKQLARVVDLPPRKSPREHASTLALVSCIIRQRQDSQSKTNSEAETEPPPEAVAAQAPAAVKKPLIKQQESESGSGVGTPHKTRSQAATPVEELRFATEISETVKRMRRGQNKYDCVPTTTPTATTERTTPARCRRPANDVNVANTVSCTRRLASTTTAPTATILGKRKRRQVAMKATGRAATAPGQQQQQQLLPGIRKLPSKKGLLEYEMEGSALKALDANMQYVSPMLIAWQIDKYLELTGRDYDLNVEEMQQQHQQQQQLDEDLRNEVVQTPPPSDYCFTSEFDLCDLLAGSAGSGDDDEFAVRTGCRRNSRLNLFSSFQRKRKCLKSNRTGWPRVQRRRAAARSLPDDEPPINFHDLGVFEEQRTTVAKQQPGVKQEPLEMEEEQTTTTTTTAATAAATTMADKEINREGDDNNDESTANGKGDVDEGEQSACEDVVMTPPATDVDEQLGNDDEEVEEEEEEDVAAATATDDDDDETMADSVDQQQNDEAEIEATDADVEEDDAEDEDEDDENEDDVDEDDEQEEEGKDEEEQGEDEEEEEDEEVYEDAYGELPTTTATTNEQLTLPNLSKSRLKSKSPPAKRETLAKTNQLDEQSPTKEEQPLQSLQTSNGYSLNVNTSTPSTRQPRHRTPQLNGSLGSCISPSEKLGDNSDIFTVSSDGLETDMDLSNTQAGDSLEHCQHHQRQHLTPTKHKFDISKYAPPNNGKAASSCAAEAATAAVKSLAISQFLKKEVRVTCRRLRAPFRRFRYRR